LKVLSFASPPPPSIWKRVWGCEIFPKG